MIVGEALKQMSRLDPALAARIPELNNILPPLVAFLRSLIDALDS